VKYRANHFILFYFIYIFYFFISFIFRVMLLLLTVVGCNVREFFLVGAVEMIIIDDDDDDDNNNNTQDDGTKPYAGVHSGPLNET